MKVHRLRNQSRDSGDGETHESGVAQPVDCRKNPPQGMSMMIEAVIPAPAQAKIQTQRQISEHEDHKPSIHDEGFRMFAKEVGNRNRSFNMCNGSTKDQCIDWKCSCLRQ